MNDRVANFPPPPRSRLLMPLHFLEPYCLSVVVQRRRQGVLCRASIRHVNPHPNCPLGEAGTVSRFLDLLTRTPAQNLTS